MSVGTLPVRGVRYPEERVSTEPVCPTAAMDNEATRGWAGPDHGLHLRRFACDSGRLTAR